MKKKLFLAAAFFAVSSLISSNSYAASNQVDLQKSAFLPMLSLEARAQTGTSSEDSDTDAVLMMNGKKFEDLMKKSQFLIDTNRAGEAYKLIKPYELYKFGSVAHWPNKALYNWHMAQIYEANRKYTDMIKYLNYIIDSQEKPKPEKDFHQYIKYVFTDNTPAKYYYGSALYASSNVYNAAKSKMQELENAANRLKARIDPRMKYENYPRMPRRTSN